MTAAEFIISKGEALSSFFNDQSSYAVTAYIGLAIFGIFGLQYVLLGSVASSIKGEVEARNEEKEAVAEWRARDKTRSARFLVRAFFHHTAVKSLKLLHGLGAFVAYFSSFILTVWMIVTGGQRGPSILAVSLPVSLLIMRLGFFTPYFQKKLQKYGKYQCEFAKFANLAIGFGMGANSIYAQHTIIPDDNENIDNTITKLCTFLSLIFPLVSLHYFAHEMIHNLSFISPVTAITFTTTLGYFYGPLVYEMFYGKQALVELYKNTRTGDVVYFLHVSGIFFTLTNVQMITLTVTKVITVEQTIRVTGKFLPIYGAFVIILLAAELGPTVALAYTFLCGLVIPFHKVFPVTKLAENQKKLGIFYVEDGGNMLWLGQEGSEKKQ